MPAMDYSKVADLYDSYVQVDLDIPFYLQETKTAKNVLELMAGTGRISIPLAEAGVNLTCVDSSPEMLAELNRKAAAKGLKINTADMDVAQLDLQQQFDLILLPFNSFSEIITPKEQRSALKAIRAHLSPHGRFICTLHNPAVRTQTIGQGLQLRGKFNQPNQTVMLWSEERLHPEGKLVLGTQFVEVYDSHGKMTEKRFTNLQFYLHTPEDFQALLEETGWQVKEVYGDYAWHRYQAESSPFINYVLTY